MQSTGQTSTHELSLVPMHGSAMTYAMSDLSGSGAQREWGPHSRLPGRASAHRRHRTDRIGAAAAPGGSAAAPAAFPRAVRGAGAVVLPAGAGRAGPAAGLEELNGLATWRLLR